mgnify:CR=1 FL=1
MRWEAMQQQYTRPVDRPSGMDVEDESVPRVAGDSIGVQVHEPKYSPQLPQEERAGGDEGAKVSGSDLGHPSVGRRADLLDPWHDPVVTNAGSTPVDLNVLPNDPMSLESTEPVLASWSRRVLASVLDSAIGAGATFLAFGPLMTKRSLPFPP